MSPVGSPCGCRARQRGEIRGTPAGLPSAGQQESPDQEESSGHRCRAVTARSPSIPSGRDRSGTSATLSTSVGRKTAVSLVGAEVPARSSRAARGGDFPHLRAPAWACGHAWAEGKGWSPQPRACGAVIPTDTGPWTSPRHPRGSARWFWCERGAAGAEQPLPAKAGRRPEG